MFNATYSPEDNKLRLYATERLDSELYQKARELGFRWAPKQELFVAPMWTPQRRDFLLELCGDIQDEMTSAAERAEQRAERFENYQAKRLKDAENAYSESQELASGIPMGQPILIGHHSQRRAEKQAERIESTMQRAVTMWDRSEYWKYRAAGVVANVKYKERQDVRLRRIKKLEASKRKQERYIKENNNFIAAWNNPDKELTKERAIGLAGFRSYGGIYNKLQNDEITPEEAKEIEIRYREKSNLFHNDWLNHYKMRIDYEKAILEAEGYTEPEKPKRPKLAPIINTKETDGIKFHGITKEEWKNIPNDYKGTKKVMKDGKCHYRYRHAMHIGEGKDRWSLTPVYLIDSKKVEVPNE